MLWVFSCLSWILLNFLFKLSLLINFGFNCFFQFILFIVWFILSIYPFPMLFLLPPYFLFSKLSNYWNFKKIVSPMREIDSNNKLKIPLIVISINSTISLKNIILILVLCTLIFLMKKIMFNASRSETEFSV